jgi:hypothetical protein
MRRGVELLRDQNILMFDGLVKIALAEAEARAGDVHRALGALVFARNGRRVTYCSPSCTPPLPHPFPPSGSPKSFMRASTRSLRTDAGFSVSSVSLTDSASQLNRETARSVTATNQVTRIILRFAQPHGLGQKVSDEFTVPLCRAHHRELHRAGTEVE